MKQLKRLSLAAPLLLIGCAPIVTDSGICQSSIVAASSKLGDALLANPDTPTEIADPAVDVVIGIETACL